ncbi:DUF3667 domain-containing protein [Undibacterium seohonense]|uniref:DUF3667 domain-containing protein n=1 Tax=Undibacterium seohonense TaxID=1344950 RepID=A0ABR6X5M4_9BURK|nr:DUF3667 domain-containing protein [Undibacterium seohonense]MBC3808176.1 DUF3667 domain-containing protein [Undibacterium seohonense]
MGIEMGNAAETLTAIVVSEELGKPNTPKHDGDTSDPNHSKQCANCGITLNGAYCHTCGQYSHIHRSLLHMFEEVLHGIFHFDTKAWRTIPALILRPGQLTKDYIEGKRTSYVSPLALFLFLIFLMFFVFSYTTSWKGEDLIKTDDSREDVTLELTQAKETLQQKRLEKSQLGEHSPEHLGLKIEIRAYEAQVLQLQDTLDAIDGNTVSVLEAKQALEQAERTLADLKTLQHKFKSEKSTDMSTKDISSSKDVKNGSTTSSSISSTANPVDTSASKQADEGKETSSDASTLDIASLKPWEIAQEIRSMENLVKYHRKRVAKAIAKHNKSKQEQTAKKEASPKTTPTAEETSASSDASASTAMSETEEATNELDDLSKIPYIGKALADINKNRELTLYKMKKNAASAAILLIPISLPFVWLLFAFSRKYVIFDHVVFSLYSLSFMSILMMVVAILSKFDFKGSAALLFAFVPPIHMFSQLRHAYSLSVPSSLWRTVALLLIASISFSIYAVVVTVLSA